MRSDVSTKLAERLCYKIALITLPWVSVLEILSFLYLTAANVRADVPTELIFRFKVKITKITVIHFVVAAGFEPAIPRLEGGCLIRT